MDQELFDWLLLLGRWVHITVAVTWIGTSIFFMWLDRSFTPNPEATSPGHVGELWMVHGGGFYKVEKLLMGPTKVPAVLHWFKWESYWTWMSGAFLVAMIFYTGDGVFLLDADVSALTYAEGVALGVFSLIGSWFFYDQVWEREFIRKTPVLGHVLTLVWFAGMSYLLCHTLSGRAAYIHIGGMLGTWMTANVFMRIIPRQIKMVEAARQGQPVNQDWGKNAKNRSTHNTYFTLPVIFIMLSNHFPNTYGHDWNWLILLALSAGGAAIREYFVVRLSQPKRSLTFGIIGVVLIASVMWLSRGPVEQAHVEIAQAAPEVVELPAQVPTVPVEVATTPVSDNSVRAVITGKVSFSGVLPPREKLRLPPGCAKGDVYSNQILVQNGVVQNVLVRIQKGHESLEVTAVPTTVLEMDQKNCQYVPRVAVARVGQPVEFINSDPIFHNVRSLTKENQRFNMAMPKQNQRERKVFTKPELFLQAKCSVHPWMGAYIAVMEHQFFAVTGPDGRFTLPELPAGTYTIEAWHEIFGTQSQEIQISSGDPVTVDFTFTK